MENKEKDGISRRDFLVSAGTAGGAAAAGVPHPPASGFQVSARARGYNALTQASPPASLRSRILVTAASTMAVAIFAAAAMAISTAVAVATATRFLAGIIATLLRCGPPFNPAHLLRSILLPVLAAVKGALLVAAVRGLPVHTLDGGPVLPAVPVRLRGALLAE